MFSSIGVKAETLDRSGTGEQRGALDTAIVGWGGDPARIGADTMMAGKETRILSTTSSSSWGLVWTSSSGLGLLSTSSSGLGLLSSSFGLGLLSTSSTGLGLLSTSSTGLMLGRGSLLSVAESFSADFPLCSDLLLWPDRSVCPLPCLNGLRLGLLSGRGLSFAVFSGCTRTLLPTALPSCGDARELAWGGTSTSSARTLEHGKSGGKEAGWVFFSGRGGFDLSGRDTSSLPGRGTSFVSERATCGLSGRGLSCTGFFGCTGTMSGTSAFFCGGVSILAGRGNCASSFAGIFAG